MQVNSWSSASAMPVRGVDVHLSEMCLVQVNSLSFASVVLVRGFGVHLFETLAGRR